LAVPHAVPALHATHVAPPRPHAVSLVPTRQAPAAQHPAHDAASQTQAPPTQRCPLPQAPSAQTPPHPSLSPQVLPVQVGVHTSASHVLDEQEVSGAASAVPQSPRHVTSKASPMSRPQPESDAKVATIAAASAP
jgi:hypothetical protein